MEPITLIYCPKCGKKVSLAPVKNPETLLALQAGDYATGSVGDCVCGVRAILGVKQMPKSPTYTLMFNIFNVEKAPKTEN